MANFEQQHVLITGCSSGIGRALVEEFARRGLRVTATARSKESLEGLSSDSVTTDRLDVTDSGSVAAAVRRCGAIDIVVNNAGFALIGPMIELRLDDLRNQFETNVVGAVAVAQAVAPQMIERRRGRVVNIGSVSGVTATPFGGAYCGSKAAIHLISDALRMELAPFGIAVIEVQPGAVASRFAENAAATIRPDHTGSFFSVVADAVEARARISETNSTSAEVVAREVVNAATAARPPALLRVGNGSRLLPAIGKLPAALRDRIFRRRFGLDRLSGGSNVQPRDRGSN
jgi:NADP-dependent 3-hydroxy acid dehydrogenase YdfG